LPISIPPDEVSHLHLTDLARRVGNTGLRLLPQMKNLATARHVNLICGDGVLCRGNAFIYLLLSDFLMMRDRKGPFAHLSDQSYYNCLQTIADEVVLGRNVRLRLIDDLSRRLPRELRIFLHGYDGIMAIDDRFTMRVHADRMIRSFCERSPAASLCNRHIDETVRMLRSLERYVVHRTSANAVAEMLKSFHRPAA
jgi:hypothetical protein